MYCPVSFTHNSMLSSCEQGSCNPKTTNQLQNHSEKITTNGTSSNKNNGVFQMFVGDLELTIHNTNDLSEDIDFEVCSTKVHIHDLDHDEGEDSGCSMSIGSPVKGSLDRKRPGILHVAPRDSLAPHTNNVSKKQNSTTTRLQGSPIHHNSFDFSSISTTSPQSSIYSHSSSPPLILSPSPTPPHEHPTEELASVSSGDVVRTFIASGSSCNTTNKDFITLDKEDHNMATGEENGNHEEEWPSFDAPMTCSAPTTTVSFTNGLIYPTANGIPLAVPPNPPPNVQYTSFMLPVSPPIAMMTFAPNQYHRPPPPLLQPMPVVSQSGVESGTTTSRSQSQQQPPSSSSSSDHQTITSYIKAQLEMLHRFHQQAAVIPPFFGSFGHPPPHPPPPSFRPHPTGQAGFTGYFPPPPPVTTTAAAATNHGLNWTPGFTVPQPPLHRTSPPPTLHPSHPHTYPPPTVYGDLPIVQQSSGKFHLCM